MITKHQLTLHLQVVAGYLGNWDPMVTLTLANAVGAATATRHGAGRNVATADAVAELLDTGMRSRDLGFAAACTAAAKCLRQLRRPH